MGYRIEVYLARGLCDYLIRVFQCRRVYLDIEKSQGITSRDCRQFVVQLRDTNSGDVIGVEWQDGYFLDKVEPSEDKKMIKVTLVNSDGRTRTNTEKPGKFLGKLIKILGVAEQIAASSNALVAWLEKFANAFKAEYMKDKILISERGDVARLYYAYLPWRGGTISESCMRSDTDPTEVRNSNLALRFDRHASELLQDHIKNINHIRVAMTYNDRYEVTARALLRDIYYEKNGVEVPYGCLLDRTYYSSDSRGYALIEQVKETLGDELKGVRAMRFRTSEGNFEWFDPELARGKYTSLDIYTPIVPRKDGKKMAFQDSFQYHDRGTNRGYIYPYLESGTDRPIRRLNAYNVNWDRFCTHCGNNIVIGNDKMPVDPNAKEFRGDLFCSEECISSFGYVPCDCGCGTIVDPKYAVIHVLNGVEKRYLNRNHAKDDGWIVCSNCYKAIHESQEGADKFLKAHEYAYFCGEDCMEEAGYHRCSCGKIVSRSQGLRLPDDNVACCEDCAKNNGWEFCKKCNTWHKIEGFKPLKIGRKKFCSEECARVNHYEQCAECGKWDSITYKSPRGKLRVGNHMSLLSPQSEAYYPHNEPKTHWCPDCAQFEYVPMSIRSYFTDNSGFGLVSTKLPRAQRERR